MSVQLMADYRHIGAWLAGLLAYPGEDETRKREQGAALFAAAQLERRAPEGFDWNSAPLELQYIRWTGRRPPIEKLIKRLQHRLLAAEVALPLVLRRVGMPIAPDAPRTLEASIARTLQRMEAVDRDNFKRRIWNPSTPVLHIAVALYLLLTQVTLAKQLPSDGSGIVGLLSNRTFLQALLQASEALEPVVFELWPRRYAHSPLQVVRANLA